MDFYINLKWLIFVDIRWCV